MNFIQRYAFDLLCAFASGQLKQVPEVTLNRWLVNLGRAFGPPGLRHFSELSVLEQYELMERVPVLRKTHSDWLKPFQWVPRRLTTWVGPMPTEKDIVAGNTSSVKPIPANGEWFVLRGYMASTTIDGVHNRLGWRPDDVDFYWTLSVAFKVIG